MANAFPTCQRSRPVLLSFLPVRTERIAMARRPRRHSLSGG